MSAPPPVILKYSIQENEIIKLPSLTGASVSSGAIDVKYFAKFEKISKDPMANMPIIYNREQENKTIRNMQKTSQNNRIALDKTVAIVYNRDMTRKDIMNIKTFLNYINYSTIRPDRISVVRWNAMLTWAKKRGYIS